METVCHAILGGQRLPSFALSRLTLPLIHQNPYQHHTTAARVYFMTLKLTFSQSHDEHCSSAYLSELSHTSSAAAFTFVEITTVRSARTALFAIPKPLAGAWQRSQAT